MPARAGAENHYECVPRDVKQGAGRGWFGFDSGAKCTDDKARDTDSQTAATMIDTACRKLYDDPRGPQAVKGPEERGIKFGDLLQ